jgi:hypothetical protein
MNDIGNPFAELTRLRAIIAEQDVLIKRLRALCDTYNDTISSLRAINAELVEALQTVLGDAEHGQHQTWAERIAVGRAAIARAKS